MNEESYIIIDNVYNKYFSSNMDTIPLEILFTIIDEDNIRSLLLTSKTNYKVCNKWISCNNQTFIDYHEDAILKSVLRSNYLPKFLFDIVYKHLDNYTSNIIIFHLLSLQNDFFFTYEEEVIITESFSSSYTSTLDFETLAYYLYKLSTQGARNDKFINYVRIQYYDRLVPHNYTMSVPVILHNALLTKSYLKSWNNLSVWIAICEECYYKDIVNSLCGIINIISMRGETEGYPNKYEVESMLELVCRTLRYAPEMKHTILREFIPVHKHIYVNNSTMFYLI